MSKPIIIAVDAMGGDNAPQKIIDGIELHHSQSKNRFYKLFLTLSKCFFLTSLENV